MVPVSVLAAWVLASTAVPAAATTSYATNAIQAADFLLSIQGSYGQISDYPGGGMVNYDSHMEYAMWGLAVAYQKTGDQKYLDGMKAGLTWLAARQRSDGSWWVGYAYLSPFDPIDSAYGVSATIGLFMHDLWWYDFLSGDHAFTTSLLPKVRSGLSFLYTKMRASDGTFRSAYVKNSNGVYVRNNYRYSSDQVDMYLGLRAASKLLGVQSYWDDAMKLRTILAGSTFYLSTYKRYALGITATGVRDTYLSLLTVWPQGYIPWVIGNFTNTRASTAWLDARERHPEGSVVFRQGAHRYALASEVLIGGHIGTGTANGTNSMQAKSWVAVRQDDGTGGVTVSPVNLDQYSNLTAFAMLCWYNMHPRLPA